MAACQAGPSVGRGLRGGAHRPDHSQIRDGHVTNHPLYAAIRIPQEKGILRIQAPTRSEEATGAEEAK